MPKPWEKYGAKKPWEKYKAKQEPSTASDFARGVAQGGTFGFGDELTGLVGGVLDPQNLAPEIQKTQQGIEALKSEAAAQDPNLVAQQMRSEGFTEDEIEKQLADIQSFQEKDAPGRYDVYRDRARRLQREAEKRSPIATSLGEMAGGIGTGALTGAASIPALIAEGALYGFGGAEGSAKEQAMQAAMGGALGGTLGGIGKGASAVAGKVKGMLGREAERQAVKALQPTTGQMSRIFDEQRMGRNLLDQGIVGVDKAFGIPYGGRSAPKMYALGQKAEAKAGKAIDRFYDMVEGQRVPPQDVVKKLLDKSVAALDEGVANEPVVNKVLKFAEKLEAKLAKSPGGVSPKTIRSERKAVDKLINWANQDEKLHANRMIRDALSEVEDEILGGPSNPAFDAVKKQYMDIRDANKILQRSSAREKSGYSLKDLMKTGGIGVGAAGVGATTENPYLAGTTALLGMGGRQMGRAGLAAMLNRMSKVQTPTVTPYLNKMIQSQNPFGP